MDYGTYPFHYITFPMAFCITIRKCTISTHSLAFVGQYWLPDHLLACVCCKASACHTVATLDVFNSQLTIPSLYKLVIHWAFFVLHVRDVIRTLMLQLMTSRPLVTTPCRHIVYIVYKSWSQIHVHLTPTVYDVHKWGTNLVFIFTLQTLVVG